MAMDRVHVAYPGEPGAYSEQAALAYFGAVEPRGFPTFRQIFEKVATGEANYGVLPIENSIMGSIHQNYDLLLEFAVSIVGEVNLRISHKLIAHQGVRLEDLKRVYAHPAAAAQCERFLRAHPEWTVFQSYDTAGSVKMIREQALRDAAAIASEQAAAKYNMAIIAEGIEDNTENYTRFIVISRSPYVHAKCTKASIVFATKNEPGALHETLKLFADCKVNLTRIESRPMAGRPWEYLFYLDFEGNTEAPDVRLVLRELEAKTQRFRVLGCYPAA